LPDGKNSGPDAWFLLALIRPRCYTDGGIEALEGMLYALWINHPFQRLDSAIRINTPQDSGP
jgi:hypothetical protein